MKAMIFAAGLGTRLKPFTLNHPKALVPVAGVPMLERVMRKLIIAGVDEFVVNVHHFSNQIIDFLENCDMGKVKIHISDESDLLLDTGGGILAARKWFGDSEEPFIVHNADILTDFDIEAMYQAHKRNKAMATLLVKQRKTSRYLVINDYMEMIGWTNVDTHQVKPSGLTFAAQNLYAFGGVHIISPDIFDALEVYAKGLKSFPIMPFYIDACSKSKICGYLPKEQYYWHDIGKPESLQKAEEEFM